MGQMNAPVGPVGPGGGANNTAADDGYGGKASGPQAPQMAAPNPWMRLLQGGLGGVGQGLQNYGRNGPGNGRMGSSLLPPGNNVNFYGGGF